MATKPIYVWTGTAWVLVGDGAGEQGMATYSTVAPAAPVDGQIWVDESGTIPVGMSSRVPGGLEFITEQSFTTATAVNVNNCFTSAYQGYRIILELVGTVAATVNSQFRFRGAGVNYTGAWYYSSAIYNSTTPTPTGEYVNNATLWGIGNVGENANMSVMDLLNPALAKNKVHTTMSIGSGTSQAYFANRAGFCLSPVAYDGFAVLAASGTFTGKVQVFGYGVDDRYISGGSVILPSQGSELYLTDNYF